MRAARSKTVEFDENGDGRPDRRLTYANGAAARPSSRSRMPTGRYLKKRVGGAVSRSRAHLRRRPSRPRRLGHPPAARNATRPRAGPDRHARAARSARPGGGELLVPGQPARVRLPRRRHGRRHPRQLHAAGRVHLRQHDDPRHGGARRARLRREEAAVPRQLVHLPARLRRSR